MDKLLPLILIGLLLSGSCRKRDIADPSYILLEEPEFQVLAGQGTELQDFSYVNVLINSNSEGIYHVPALFPVLYSGNVEVGTQPMIKWLARSGLHPYTMVEGTLQAMELNPLRTDTLRPVFRYRDNLEFVWLEDFNDNEASFQLKSGTLDTFYVQNDTNGLDGTPYLYIPMGNGEQFFELESRDLYEVAQDGREVIMEIHYKTNVPFTIGVFATSPSMVEVIPSVTPFSTDGEWKKGYIYLTDEVFNQGADVKFRFFFRAANVEVQNPEIFIDNIKLLYRKG